MATILKEQSSSFVVAKETPKEDLGAGDSFCIAPHLDHGAVRLESGVLSDSFNPLLEDFLGEGA
ncbi:hypothetical protein EH31_13040 [Erythrobacter longus]|uniref:Uncharacterized protein n=1 Tax=Erythrobacter longus TaxID=1044 RepID=A0A074M6H0_ERYLO|nr:hypothetical protein [Erythrobacter longus]KEO88969.1 hypothetical protein EH31_13040 [Erythrobacter longus]